MIRRFVVISVAFNTESSFCGILIQESIFEKIRAGFDLIHFYCETDETHPYFPMLKSDTPVQVNFITDSSTIPGFKSEALK
ncbi:MAG: hypothetical protein JWP78_1003 [Mucilaginibacter sp.]|nr:hypothetical protein [Mucilaginibacter sp.]